MHPLPTQTSPHMRPALRFMWLPSIASARPCPPQLKGWARLDACTCVCLCTTHQQQGHSEACKAEGGLVGHSDAAGNHSGAR